MSDDGFSDGCDEPDMEIQVKSLFGSTTDLRVSATETIRQIKQKIERVEGESKNLSNKWHFEDHESFIYLHHVLGMLLFIEINQINLDSL